MGLRAPTPLDVGHALESFDCGKPALNDWLHRQARQAQSSGSARTFIVADDDHVVGYYSLTVGQVDVLDAPQRVRKGMGQYPVPVVILARMAVALADLGCDIDAGLLQGASVARCPSPGRPAYAPCSRIPSTTRRRASIGVLASCPRRCARSSGCCC